MTNPVDDYVNRYEGKQKEWLNTFITFMRENFPEIQETISYQIPVYKFNKKYIGFSIAKDHFSYHSLDFEMIEALKNRLPRAKFGKGCAKVAYDDQAAIPILFEMSRTIIERSKAAGGAKQPGSR